MNTLSNSKPLAGYNVLALLVFTLVGYSLFAFLTDLDDFGLGQARQPENWQKWRYLVVSGWLGLALIWYLVCRRRAYFASLLTGFVFALLESGIVALWWFINAKTGPVILLTALFYSLNVALFSMTARNNLTALLVGIVFIWILMAVDVIVLGAAGNFRIH